MDFHEELAAKIKAHSKKIGAKSTNFDTPHRAPFDSASPIVNQEKKLSKSSFLALMSPGNSVVCKKDCNFVRH